MNKEKINILFVNKDKAGVNYYRTLTPAIALQNKFPDEFNVEINPNPDFEDLDYLRKFQIIHFHRTLDHTYEKIELLQFKLKKLGIKTVVDLDDYWELSKFHPLYHQIKETGTDKKIKQVIKISDYVTTTTKFFASEIAKINKNVKILPNAIDINDKQWQHKKTDNGFVNFGVLCGSSHEHDLKLLKGVTDKLENTASTKGKFKHFLVGYDLRGKIKSRTIDEGFIELMQKTKMWTQPLVNELEKLNWDIRQSRIIPNEIKSKFPNGILKLKEEVIKPKDSVWYKYETILKGEYNKLGLTQDYLDFLDKFENKKFSGVEKERFERIYTRHISSFGKGYQHFDVGLAPINDVKSPYNRSKSNLKIVENGIHKNAVIVSDIDCYNEIQDGKTGLVVKNNTPNYWFKAMKKCVANPSMVEDMGEALYEYVVENYDINKIIDERADFYKKIVND